MFPLTLTEIKGFPLFGKSKNVFQTLTSNELPPINKSAFVILLKLKDITGEIIDELLLNRKSCISPSGFPLLHVISAGGTESVIFLPLIPPNT